MKSKIWWELTNRFCLLKAQKGLRALRILINTFGSVTTFTCTQIFQFSALISKKTVL